jgi:hypothetical protein
MGKDDDVVRKAAERALGQKPPDLKVAAPFNDIQTLAWVAAMLYPHVSFMATPAQEAKEQARASVDAAVELFAYAAVAAQSGDLVNRMTRYIQERKDRDNGPSLVPN